MRSKLTVLMMLLTVLAAGAAVGNPPFEINRRNTLVELGEMGRATLIYDLTGVPASALRVDLIPQKSARPIKSWNFPAGRGTRRLDLSDLAVGVYFFQGVLLDANGQSLGEIGHPITLEYGGFKLFRQTHPIHTPTVTAKQVPIDPSSTEPPGLTLDPPSLVINAGDSGELNAYLKGFKSAQELIWQLDGRGDLDKISNTVARYRIDKDAPAGKSATIRVFVRDNPSVQAHVNVLVTNVRKDDIQR